MQALFNNCNIPAALYQQNDELRERMQELVDLYRDLVGACQAEQQRIADELRQINQSKKSAKVYQMFG